VRVAELANLRCFRAIHVSVTILLQFSHPWKSKGFNMGAFTSGIFWPLTSKQLFLSQFSVRFSHVDFCAGVFDKNHINTGMLIGLTLQKPVCQLYGDKSQRCRSTKNGGPVRGPIECPALFPLPLLSLPMELGPLKLLESSYGIWGRRKLSP